MPSRFIEAPETRSERTEFDARQIRFRFGPVVPADRMAETKSIFRIGARVAFEAICTTDRRRLARRRGHVRNMAFARQPKANDFHILMNLNEGRRRHRARPSRARGLSARGKLCGAMCFFGNSFDPAEARSRRPSASRLRVQSPNRRCCARAEFWEAGRIPAPKPPILCEAPKRASFIETSLFSRPAKTLRRRAAALLEPKTKGSMLAP